MYATPILRTNSTGGRKQSDTALDMTNLSSTSEEGFVVEPLTLPEMEDRFRIASSSIASMLVAIMGSTEASLFVTKSMETGSRGCIDTRGTTIESVLMDLLSDLPDISPVTFIDSSEEELDPFPDANYANVQRNAYRRPTQRVTPIPRPQIANPEQQPDATRNINPPAIPSQVSAFTAYVAPQQRTADFNARPVQQAAYLLMPVPFYPNGRNNQGFGPVSNNVHSMPANNVSAHYGQILQMNPPVMPEVAGYCSSCMKTYDHIAVETLISYIAWSEYPEETIRDRNVRSRAFVDGFGAALICFKNAGLSPGYP